MPASRPSATVAPASIRATSFLARACSLCSWRLAALAARSRGDQAAPACGACPRRQPHPPRQARAARAASHRRDCRSAWGTRRASRCRRPTERWRPRAPSAADSRATMPRERRPHAPVHSLSRGPQLLRPALGMLAGMGRGPARRAGAASSQMARARRPAPRQPRPGPRLARRPWWRRITPKRRGPRPARR